MSCLCTQMRNTKNGQTNGKCCLNLLLFKMNNQNIALNYGIRSGDLTTAEFCRVLSLQMNCKRQLLACTGKLDLV